MIFKKPEDSHTEARDREFEKCFSKHHVNSNEEKSPFDDFDISKSTLKEWTW